MTRLKLALSIFSCLLILSESYAQNNFVFYGKANVSINKLDDVSKGIDEWQLNSNASRIGVKGSYSINNSLKSIYKMEYEVHIDDGESSSSKGKNTVEQRNIYVGLQGKFGSIIAGKHDTPLKLAQGGMDRFNDQVLGDIKNYMEGEDRVSNMLMYTSPNAKGFYARVAFVALENSKDLVNSRRSSNGQSYSIGYSNDWLSASIAHNTHIDEQDTNRLVTEFTVNKTKIGLLLQNVISNNGSSEEDSLLVSAEQRLSSGWSLKLQYGLTDKGKEEDAQLALGVDRRLSKNAKLFAYYSNIERMRLSSQIDDATFAVGYELKF